MSDSRGINLLKFINNIPTFCRMLECCFKFVNAEDTTLILRRWQMARYDA